MRRTYRRASDVDVGTAIVYRPKPWMTRELRVSGKETVELSDDGPGWDVIEFTYEDGQTGRWYAHHHMEVWA